MMPHGDITRVKYLDEVDMPKDEFAICQSSILALMGIRDNEDLDIITPNEPTKRTAPHTEHSLSAWGCGSTNGHIESVHPYDYGIDNIFTSIDSFPPDFIVFSNGKIYCVEAKKTGGNSIRYGDNLPKPDFIYVLRDTKNNIQTYYYGDEIISTDKGNKIQELREDFKEDVKKLIEKYDEVEELSDGLFSFSLRAGVGATKGGKKTNPSLSPYRKQREQRVLETVNGI